MKLLGFIAATLLGLLTWFGFVAVSLLVEGGKIFGIGAIGGAAMTLAMFALFGMALHLEDKQ